MKFGQLSLSIIKMDSSWDIDQFLHIGSEIKTSDRDARNKWLLITYFGPDWGSCFSPEDCAKDVNNRLFSIESETRTQFESAIWQIEAAPSTGSLHTHIQLTSGNTNLKIPGYVFRYFPGARIIAIPKNGVDAVREYCSKLESRVSDVHCFGNINEELYIDKWRGKVKLFDREELKREAAMKASKASLDRKPLIRAMKEIREEMEVVPTKEKRDELELEYDRLSKLTPEQFKEEWVPPYGDSPKYSYRALWIEATKSGCSRRSAVWKKSSDPDYDYTKKELKAMEEEAKGVEIQKEKQRKQSLEQKRIAELSRRKKVVIKYRPRCRLEQEESFRRGYEIFKTIYIDEVGGKEDIVEWCRWYDSLVSKENLYNVYEEDYEEVVEEAVKKVEEFKVAPVRLAVTELVNYVEIADVERRMKKIKSEKEKAIMKKLKELNSYMEGLDSDNEEMPLLKVQYSELLHKGKISTFSLKPVKVSVKIVKLRKN